MSGKLHTAKTESADIEDPVGIGEALKRLRTDAGLGLRELARHARLSATALAAIESGKSSPTLATLHKLLAALGTDFARFFNRPAVTAEHTLFRSQDHQTVRDAYRCYEFLLPKGPGLRFEMLLETVAGGEQRPEWEVHECDIGGWILAGGPARLEIDGVGAWTIRAGDSFYIRAGQKHRAANLGKRPLKMITVLDPARY